MSSQKIVDKIKQRSTEWKEKSLTVDCDQLSKADWRFFCGILKTNKGIRGLQLNGELSVGFARLLYKAMKDKVLLSLMVSSIHDSGIKYLCSAIQEAKLVAALTLGQHFTFGSDESLQLFCGSLKHIQMLHLHRADDKVGIEIAKALKTNTSLTDLIFLDCESNGTGLSKEAHRELGEALAVNKSLMKLQLSNCGTDDEDYLNVMAGLAKHPRVHIFHITSKHITDPYLPMANVLKVNSTLTDLSIDMEVFDEKGLLAFAEVMKKNTTMQKLSIQSVLDEVEVVAEILKVNRSLTEVDLTKRYIEDENEYDYCHHFEEAARLINEALKGNDSMHSIKLWSIEEQCYHSKDTMTELLTNNKALSDIGPIDEEECPELLKLVEENKKTQAHYHAITQRAMMTIASTAKFLDIFPEEIWLNIFKFIYFPGVDYHTRFDDTLKSLFALHQIKRATSPVAPTKLNANMLMDWISLAMDIKQQPFDPSIIIAGDEESKEALAQIGTFLLSADF